MKLKNLFLSLVIFSLGISAQAISKEAKLKDLSKNISSEISKNSNDKDNREDLSAVDFTKLFNEAQNYYKLAKNWKILKCEPKSGFICTKHECKRRDISSYIILDKNKNSITRCDKENCETFEAQFEQTGSFVNIQSKGAIGSLIRILGDSRYKEITTVGLDAYIANGDCTVANDDLTIKNN